MTLWPSVYRGSGSLPTRFASPVKGLPVSPASQRALREAEALTSGRTSLSLKGGCKTPSRQYPLSGTSQGICVSLSQSPPDPCSQLSFSSCNQLDLICIIRPLGTKHVAWLPPCLALLAQVSRAPEKEGRLLLLGAGSVLSHMLQDKWVTER